MRQLGTEPGWRGIFWREQAEGAIANNTIIRKVNSVEGEDAHQDGALGTILGSIKSPPDLREQTGEDYAYFIEWEDRPRVAVAIAGSRVEVVGSGIEVS